MPRRNRNAGGVAKRRTRKHRNKMTERTAPLTPQHFHGAPRMHPRGGRAG